MARKNILSLLLAGCGAVLLQLYGAPPDKDILTIRLLQDNGQTCMVSKFYESVPDTISREIRKMSDDVSRSREHPLRNLGFEQFGIDSKKIE